MSARTRLAVSAVTCRHAATAIPSSGRSSARRARIERRTGIWASAHSMRARPAGAREGSAMSEVLTGIADPLPALVAVVVGLVRALDRHADVGRLLGRELGELHAEAVEVQARDLLVEVLGQDVDLLVVLVVLGEQLDLGDRLVRERVGHHERRVAGRIAEVEQAPLGQDDDAVAVGEDPLVDLRLDRHAPDAGGLLEPAMSISLSKWPMLPTMAWCFMRAMSAAVMMSLLPVAVMKMSAVSTMSTSVATW